MTTYELQGIRLEDGRVRISCESLPGFRLVVHPDEDLEREVTSALKVFLPYHDAAEAMQAARTRITRVARSNRSTNKDIHLSAELAAA